MRLYRTGDFARMLPDGNIEFHGRVDNQLKIRGFRVELGEIESVISKIEGVIETVIKPVKIEEGDYKLVAFLNVKESFKMDLKEMSSLVKEKLPSYMVPSAYKLMHGFPKTINGKIDKKALNFDLQELKNKSVVENQPLSTTERIIHDIWCQALKTNDISVTDNFFDIGGNSLLAINLVSMLSKAFNITLKTFMIFEFPTIKDQSSFLEGKDSDNLSQKNIEIDEKNQRKKNVNFKKHR
jgi:acyl carrier protein